MDRTVSFLLSMVVCMFMVFGCGGGGSGDSDSDDNFRLLISDENNAIEDFSELWITITSIGVHKGDENAEWIEFAPQTRKVNLRELTGDHATAIWGGELEPGDYTKVFIYVSEVRGLLNEDAEEETIELQLPSDKLQISKPFTIEDNGTLNFVYDVTVIKTGNGEYKLLPQIGESGANVPFTEVDGESDEDA